MDIGFKADVHSHILPGVDDGSPSTAESVAIISAMREAGVERFTFTPHISCGLFPNTSDALRHRFETFIGELPQSLVSGATFQLAAEYMIDEAFDDMLAAARRGGPDGGFNCDSAADVDSVQRPLTFPDGSILIEMSYHSRSPQLLQTVFNLIQDGYKPILAHPERYCFYFGEGRKASSNVAAGSAFGRLGAKLAGRFGLGKENRVRELPELEKLVSMGCRLQLNIQSLTGCYGTASMENLLYLLEHNMYSFVATDIHSVHQFSHYGDFELTPEQLSGIRILAENNLNLF